MWYFKVRAESASNFVVLKSGERMKTVKMREDKKQIVTHFEASTIKEDSEKPTQTKTVTDLGMSPCSNYLLQWRKRWTGVE